MDVPPVQAVGVHDHGWAAVLELAADIDTELLQRIQKVADGTLPHPRNTVEAVGAFAKREHRGEKANRGSRITHEEFRSSLWNPLVVFDLFVALVTSHFNRIGFPV